MEQNEETKKKSFKEKLVNFYKLNKIKSYILISFIFFGIISTFFLKYINEKNNILTAEKYIQAGIYLSLKKNENAKNLFEEIILSKNKFYSILALNNIIENDLIEDKEKILNYFNLLEENSKLKKNKDLIKLKKALFLIKNSEEKNASKLLNNLITNNSNFKSIAQDLLEK